MKKSFKLFKLIAIGFGAVCMTGCSLLGGGNTNNDNNQTENENKTNTNTEETTGGKTNTEDEGNKTVAVTSVTLDKNEYTMELNTTVQLVATVAPEDATEKDITWSTSSSTYATVSADGLVTAKKKGTATITAKTKNGKKDTCKITVVDTPVIIDEKFANEKTYIYSGSFTFLTTTTEYDLRYVFKTDGAVAISDKVKQTEVNLTYRVNDDMIFIYNGTNIENMFFYYGNILLEASLSPVVLVRDGSAVSQLGTGLLGYYAVIEAHVGDTLGVLTGVEGSAGYYIKLQKNGELYEKKINYVKADQISSSAFDSNVTTVGKKIVKINVDGTLYNCLLVVTEAAA